MKVKLTNHFIKNQLTCPDDKKQIEYCDNEMPGLYCLVTRTTPGQGGFFLRYKNDAGKTCHEKIGRTTDISLADARAKAKTLKAEIVLGSDPRAAEKERNAVISYRDFMAQYYFPHIATRKKSFKKDEQLYRTHLEDEFGSIKLSRISRLAAEQFYGKLQISGLAVATCNHYIKLLRHSLNICVDFGLLEKSPLLGMKLRPENNHLDRYLSNEELSRFIKILRSDHNRPVCQILLWCLGIGCRKSESMLARVAEIDFEQKVWTIPSQNSKSGVARTVALSDFAMEILKERHIQSEWLFPNPKTDRPYVTISRVFYRLRSMANLSDDVKIHSLRHGFATYLAQAGLNGPAIQHAMGHADFRTSARYIHMNSKVLVDASNTVAERIDSAMKAASGEN